MDSVLRFTINRPKVIYEVLDGELVMINLETGNYYTMDQVGADIWTMVEHGESVSQIISGLADRYKVSEEQVTQAVNEFIAELVVEELVVRDHQAIKRNFQNATYDKAHSAGDEKELVFSSPFLQKYSDMKELLLLDPIHEVDEAGWPNLKGKV